MYFGTLVCAFLALCASCACNVVVRFLGGGGAGAEGGGAKGDGRRGRQGEVGRHLSPFSQNASARAEERHQKCAFEVNIRGYLYFLGSVCVGGGATLCPNKLLGATHRLRFPDIASRRLEVPSSWLALGGWTTVSSSKKHVLCGSKLGSNYGVFQGQRKWNCNFHQNVMLHAH